jgi:ribosomal protein S18 acetylase RimI-like enzyme
MLHEATDRQLVLACADNHRQWMCGLARAAGGEVARVGGATLAYTPPPVAEVFVTFPRLPAADAGARLDAVLAYCRARPLSQAGCWSLLPATPRDLGARLLARGFEWGWQPHWMAIDLRALPEVPAPPGVTVAPAAEEVWDQHPHLAYHPDTNPFWREALRREYALGRAGPGAAQHFAAWHDGRPAGGSLVYLSRGRLGVAGIYQVGVPPALRNRGIGKAVTLAACRHAAQLGYRFAVLNATPLGEPAYRRLGFRSLGYGQTWWLHRAALERPAPSPLQVAFVEALGRGDMAALNELRPALPPGALDEPLPCGITPLALAVTVGKNASAEWLIAQGAAPDVLALWDLGWASRLPALLNAHPEAVSRRAGAMGATPLHHAALRGDKALVALLLAHGADASLADHTSTSPPAGWARHAGHADVAALIERRAAQ